MLTKDIAKECYEEIPSFRINVGADGNIYIYMHIQYKIRVCIYLKKSEKYTGNTVKELLLLKTEPHNI